MWDHGWCYRGEGDLAAVHALAWDPDTVAEPYGWFKRACTCPRFLES